MTDKERIEAISKLSMERWAAISQEVEKYTQVMGNKLETCDPSDPAIFAELVAVCGAATELVIKNFLPVQMTSEMACELVTTLVLNGLMERLGPKTIALAVTMMPLDTLNMVLDIAGQPDAKARTRPVAPATKARGHVPGSRNQRRW